jgi:RNA-dependent RNA polymerase
MVSAYTENILELLTVQIACTQERGGRKEYIKGPVLISRSPTVAPGDARMVMAIGEPEDGTPTAIYKNHTNCVIFACKGGRSLPSMLAGGDLDGDEYLLITEERLHPPKQYDPSPMVHLNLLHSTATRRSTTLQTLSSTTSTMTYWGSLLRSN